MLGQLICHNTVDAFLIDQLRRKSDSFYTTVQKTPIFKCFLNSDDMAKFMKCISYTKFGLTLSNLFHAKLVWLL